MPDDPEKPAPRTFVHIAQSTPFRGLHIKGGSIKGFDRIIDSPNAEIHDLTIEGGVFEVGEDFIRVAGGSNFHIAPTLVASWKDQRAEFTQLVEVARTEKSATAFEKVRSFLTSFVRPSEIEALISLIQRM